MVSTATALRWSRTINQRAAAIDSGERKAIVVMTEMGIVAAAATAVMAAPTVAKAVPTVANATADAAVK